MTEDPVAERPKADGWALSPDSRRPLPELIADHIRRRIEAGDLAPGDRLPTEPELAAEMQVARSSLRTALQRLELRGLVEVVRGRGWYVRSTGAVAADAPPPWAIDREHDDAELLEVRIGLENLAVSLACTRATSGELDDLAKRSAAHKSAPGANRDELLATDEAFHEGVVRASHNDFLVHLYQTLVPLFRRHRFDSYANGHSQSAQQHDQVVMFLKRRDEVAVRTAMTTHLLGLYDDVIARRAEKPDAEATLDTFVGVTEEASWSAPRAD